MKKWLCAILCVLIFSVMVTSVMAAPEEPVIIMQPQNPNYPEYSVAEYTVKVTGTNLTATWYIEWQGEVYNASDYTDGFEPWEAYAGETYGAVQEDANTFTFFFGGAEWQLNGATIWCVIEDGHYSITSQKAYINLGNPADPPEILDFPAQITVEQGGEAQIRCVARSIDETQLGYIWYETPTGNLPDIQAMDRGTEMGDCISCDTSVVGTRYYVCAVNTSAGGICYSSVVPVTVVPKSQAVEAPEILTDALPEAVAGQEYSTKISCSDPEAEFAVYYNPGKENDFEKTGLTLAKDGTLTGTPAEPGSYTFCICAAGDGGEEYAVYTLIVAQAAEEPSQGASEEPTSTGTEEPPENTKPADHAPIQPVQQESPHQQDDSQQDAPEGISWWVVVLIGIAAAGAGVGVAFLLIKRKPPKAA